MAIPVASSPLGSAAVSSNPGDPQPRGVENASHVTFSRLTILPRKSILVLAVTLCYCLGYLYAVWTPVSLPGSAGIGSWRDSFRDHVKPIKPLHHCTIWYSATKTKDQSIEYERHFKIPCGYGLLVYNVGPAQDYQPFKYDIYEDGYVYDDNNGLCFFYPSYQAFQKGDAPFWEPQDATNFAVKLGLDPQKISSRVVVPAKAKKINPVKGGDFAVIAHGNFYTPYFYQTLKATVNSWSFDDLEQAQDFIQLQVAELVEQAVEASSS
jgi:hypothetical protein